MLVVTANWAIPDGSVAAAPGTALFKEFFSDLHGAALRAGFRRDGRYRPIERLAIVLAGDTLDGLVSSRWLEDVRPWDRRRQAVAVHADVFTSAWRRARRPLAVLGRLARRGITVPGANRHGRPDPSLSHAVPVRVALLLGDRDGGLMRCGIDLSAIQSRCCIGHSWDFGGFHVVHGSSCDPLCVGESEPTLLASLAVDLVARFGVILASRWTLAERGKRFIRLVADGQPLDMPLLLRAAMRAECDAGESVWITDAWRRSVDRWAKEARRLGCDEQPTVIEALATWMHSLIDGPMPAPAVRRVVAALEAPLSPIGTGTGDGPRVVLGHPAMVVGSGPAEVVCLGRPTVRTSFGVASAASRSTAVSCVEARVSTAPRRLPAVAICENGEGHGQGPDWCPMWEAEAMPSERLETSSILDAA